MITKEQYCSPPNTVIGIETRPSQRILVGFVLRL